MISGWTPSAQGSEGTSFGAPSQAGIIVLLRRSICPTDTGGNGPTCPGHDALCDAPDAEPMIWSTRILNFGVGSYVVKVAQLAALCRTADVGLVIVANDLTARQHEVLAAILACPVMCPRESLGVLLGRIVAGTQSMT